MYRLFFYCLYRTILLRNTDAVFQASVLTSMLIIGHVIIGLCLIEILFVKLFATSIGEWNPINGRLAVGIASLTILVFVYRYFRKNLHSILKTYESRYASTSHWVGFAVCVAILFANGFLFLAIIDFTLNVVGSNR